MYGTHTYEKYGTTFVRILLWSKSEVIAGFKTRIVEEFWIIPDSHKTKSNELRIRRHRRSFTSIIYLDDDWTRPVSYTRHNISYRNHFQLTKHRSI